jgi:hypothetical protein
VRNIQRQPFEGGIDEEQTNRLMTVLDDLVAASEGLKAAIIERRDMEGAEHGAESEPHTSTNQVLPEDDHV